MRKDKKSFLIACIIGDGYINTYKGSKTCGLEITHTESQLDYLKWKADKLHKYLGKKVEVKLKSKAVIKTYKNRPIKSSACYRLQVCHKYFRVLRKWLYPNGKKHYSNYLKYLDNQGLAIWFMDDGSLYKEKDRPIVATIELYTHTDLEETLKMIDWFKTTHSIEFHLHKKTEDQYSMRCYTKNSWKFRELVKDYIHPCMQYKIDFPEYYFQERRAQ